MSQANRVKNLKQENVFQWRVGDSNSESAATLLIFIQEATKRESELHELVLLVDRDVSDEERD